MNTQETLQDRRLSAATATFEAYEFGTEPESADGWEFTTPGDEFVRQVYFRPLEDEDQAATVKGHFVVRFHQGTVEVSECYAMIAGNIVGHAPDVGR